MREGQWARAAELAAWVENHDSTAEAAVAMRLLKIVEEAGEAASAYIGMTGQNPRKGVTHTREQVAEELCDVIITAMVALHDFAFEPGLAFDRVMASRYQRARGAVRAKEHGADTQQTGPQG